MFETKLNVLFKLFAILYADDNILLAESSEELKKQLFYRRRWNLKMINLEYLSI